MADRLLIDTDILVDYLRNRAEAVAYLENITEPLLISVITIAIAGGLHRRQYHKSHSVSLADALIAATAEHHQAKLVTLNRKRFPMMQDVIVPYIKA